MSSMSGGRELLVGATSLSSRKENNKAESKSSSVVVMEPLTSKRRVLLPSLGGRKPLGSLGEVPSSASGIVRRDSFDETIASRSTQHTQSSASASHFSSSTAASSILGDTIDHSTSTSSSSSLSHKSLSNRRAMRSNNGDISNGEQQQQQHTSNSISSAISYTKTYEERVLRYGETVDSLFCLSSEQHQQQQHRRDSDNDGIGVCGKTYEHQKILCQEICTGDKSSDANAWREALELSLEANDHATDTINDGEIEGGVGGRRSDVGKRLIQLHRRATSRFKLSTEKDGPNQYASLQIWLLYALVLLKYNNGQYNASPPNNNYGANAEGTTSTSTSCSNSSNDARQTLKHVQRVYFGNCGQEFYGALLVVVVVDEEGKGGGVVIKDVEGVVTSLQRVMEGGMSVVDIVRSQMSRLVKSGLVEGNDASAGRMVDASAAAAPVRLISLPSLGGAKRSKNLPSLGKGTAETLNKTELRSTTTNDRDTKQTSTKKPSTKVPSSLSSSYQRSKRPLLKSSPDLNQSTLSESSTINPSLRAKLDSRKKMKTSSDRTTPHPYRSRKTGSSSGPRKGGGGGLSAILSQTMDEEEDESDDSGEDVTNSSSYLKAKRSAESCASAVTAKRSADSCASDNNTLFQDISPIDTEHTASSVKDMDLSYLHNWDPTKRDGPKKKSVTIAADAKKESKKASAVSVPKIMAKDLGYMMNWNPFGSSSSSSDRGGQKKEDDEDDSSADSSRAGGVVVTQRSNAQNNMSTIDEATEGSVTAGEGDNNNAMLSQSRSSCTSQESNNKSRSDSRRSRNSAGTSTESHGDNKSRNDEDQSSSQENMITTSKLDCSFLPLIEKKNIIRVEDEPYAKLGVIGKGGSCKVYRALSRDCDVVALKKVKLDGLNKAAIDGYANEIALLKRLKGNPAIIQLYSAEVDLDRKSILLVMEVGEVDLNYVLRQQELLSSKQGRGAGRSSLNMNFIRLTWQQMLTAVHSIHEERIIHSDLKPANFLFVRGALKLIDFGIAKAIERDDTTNVYRETLSGTLSYMSPEAIMDTSTNAKGVRVNKCGRPSDIWSLGCILYQMVYGKTPFADCHGIPQKVLAITNVNHVIQYPEGIDESAIDAMKCCLQRNPKERPPIIGRNGLLNEHCFLHGNQRAGRR